jgi:ATP-dependent DNA helicase PIF1
MEGQNVFYTGSAGVGKSTVLKNFVSRVRKQQKKIDIIAPSGIAALNVGGVTTYSYAGWTPDSFKEPLENILAAAHGLKVRKRLCKTDVLVIDEISMVERDMFIRLDLIMRESRHGWKDPGNPREKPLSVHSRFAPFGGVQLVVTGDFCQLPPVKPFRFCLHCGGDELPDHDKQDGRPHTCRKCSRTYRDEDKWAFRCENWKNCEFSSFELKHVHRQSDIQFINILQKCRYDEELLPKEKELLLKPKADPSGAVQLLPRRSEVEAVNASKFKLLQGAIQEYACHDIFSWRNSDEPELKKKGRLRYPDRPDGPLEALKDHRYEEVIELKVGMLVILLCNLSFSDGLVNGSQGKIIGFEPYDPNKPVVAQPREASPTRSGKGGRENSLHLERVEFQDAQIREFISKAKLKEWPIVQFANGITRPIYAQCPINEVGIDKPYSLLARTQIPLVAAWAITIHKSQGLSLDKVIVNLQNTFEREQVRNPGVSNLPCRC